jgi:hypothetical protein
MTWHLGVCAADSGAALRARAAALRRRLRLSTCDRLRSWVSRHDGPGERDGTLPPGGLEGIIAGRCFLSSRDHDGARRRCSRCRLGHRRLGMAGKQGDGHGGKDASQEAGVGFRSNRVTGAAPPEPSLEPTARAEHPGRIPVRRRRGPRMPGGAHARRAQRGSLHAAAVPPGPAGGWHPLCALADRRARRSRSVLGAARRSHGAHQISLARTRRRPDRGCAVIGSRCSGALRALLWLGSTEPTRCLEPKHRGGVTWKR